MRMRRWAGMWLGLWLAACVGPAERAEAPIDPERPWRKAGDVIDSIFPMEVMVARFRAGTDSVAGLRGGEATREALARRFLDAVSAGDSAALVGLLVTRPEFAWVLFPDHLYARPPYELDPAVHWLQIQASSAKGMARVLERYGNRPLAFEQVRCERDTMQFTSGPTVAWAPCTVTFRGNDSTLTRRLFGTIIERDGTAKFLGYANDF